MLLDSYLLSPLYASLLALVCAGYAAIAFAIRDTMPDLAGVLLYLALGFGVAGVGYAGAGPGVFFKRPDGTRAIGGYVLAGPFFVSVALARFVLRTATREGPWDLVAPGLYVGRLVPHRALPDDALTVVDLTSEMLEDRRTRLGCRYLCLPVLDGTPPPIDALVELTKQTLGSPGPWYVHCAAGHGRSAMLAAVLLVIRGDAPDVRSAEALMKKSRPRVHLTRAQARVAEAAIAVLVAK